MFHIILLYGVSCGLVGWFVSLLALWACIKGVSWTPVGSRSKAGELCFNECHASSDSFPSLLPPPIL